MRPYLTRMQFYEQKISQVSAVVMSFNCPIVVHNSLHTELFSYLFTVWLLRTWTPAAAQRVDVLWCNLLLSRLAMRQLYMSPLQVTFDNTGSTKIIFKSSSDRVPIKQVKLKLHMSSAGNYRWKKVQLKLFQDPLSCKLEFAIKSVHLSHTDTLASSIIIFSKSVTAWPKWNYK
jgi:hypothetical protein